MFTESDPVCTSNVSDTNIAVEGDVLVFECAVNHSGRWAPRMTWRDRTNNVLESTNLSVDGIARYQLTVTVEEAVTPLAFSCVTDFEDVTGTGVDEATNNIEYMNMYSSGDIAVHCKRKIIILQHNIKL